jgi:FkbM family methyltransferase
MKAAVRRLIRRSFRKRGYLVAKYPSVSFPTVSVFDLAVQLLMASRGRECTFVEIGANNGRFGDPIYRYVIDFPWRGILVEPQPEVFASLRANYAAAADRLIFENIAISKDRRELVLYRAPRGATTDDVFASSVVSANPALVAMQLAISQHELESFSVPCMTLDALLQRHHWRTFDVLMLDTEGNDLEVLESLDLKAFRPLVVQFEHGHLPPRKIDRAVSYLAASGYRILYGGYQIDTVAVHESLQRLVDDALLPAGSLAASR